jgi:hypothetical protein
VVIPKRFELQIEEFDKNRSTMTNILEYTSVALNSIEVEWQVDSIYMLVKMSRGYLNRSILMAEILSDRVNPKNKNRRGDAISRDIILDQCVSSGFSTEYRLFSITAV